MNFARTQRARLCKVRSVLQSNSYSLEETVTTWGGGEGVRREGWLRGREAIGIKLHSAYSITTINH